MLRGIERARALREKRAATNDGDYDKKEDLAKKVTRDLDRLEVLNLELGNKSF